MTKVLKDGLQFARKAYGKAYKPNDVIEWRVHKKTNKLRTALHNQRGYGIQDEEKVDLRFGRRWSRWGLYAKYAAPNLNSAIGDALFALSSMSNFP